jgi:Zn-dependent protease
MDLTIMSQVISLAVALTVHEFSHALVAYKLGDPTAKYAGRLTLNPIKHIDLFGTVLFPLVLILTRAPFVFGWAKPVPVNPYNLKGKYGESWVSLAGPGANFAVAIGISLLLRFLPDQTLASWTNNFQELMFLLVAINVTFGIFNLIPIPPLDGSKILMDFLPSSMNRLKNFLNRYGTILLMAFILFGGNFLFLAVAFVLKILLGEMV